MTSLRQAINDHCKQCIYDPYEPGQWRVQVTECPCVDCPLYPVRPLTGKKEVLERVVSLRGKIK